MIPASVSFRTSGGVWEQRKGRAGFVCFVLFCWFVCFVGSVLLVLCVLKSPQLQRLACMKEGFLSVEQARNMGYDHLATSTRYGDTCCGSCGSVNTGELVKGTGAIMGRWIGVLPWSSQTLCKRCQSVLKGHSRSFKSAQHPTTPSDCLELEYLLGFYAVASAESMQANGIGVPAHHSCGFLRFIWKGKGLRPLLHRNGV